MFRYMIDITAWAVTFSFLAFILAFAAEGRGAHLMRVLLGLAPRKQGLEAFESVPRDDGDWRVIAALEEPQRRSRPASIPPRLERESSRRTGAPA
jgi:hypothetical protein